MELGCLFLVSLLRNFEEEEQAKDGEERKEGEAEEEETGTICF